MLFDLPRDTIFLMQTTSSSQKPIGIFDSGVGGLSVLRAIRAQLPFERLVYVADQAHIPYGPRDINQIRAFAFRITDFLLEEGAKLIVVACNTASAAALHELREAYSEVQFVGMEPALKPAVEITKSRKVGVLATPTTFNGELYTTLVDRFAHNIEIFKYTCPGLVEQIEQGELDNPTTFAILEAGLKPMLAAGVDTIVLGCTHYPFVIPQIQSITGRDVQTIDPAPAIARQTLRLLNESSLVNPANEISATYFFTSGLPSSLKELLPRLLPAPLYREGFDKIRGLTWKKGHQLKLA